MTDLFTYAQLGEDVSKHAEKHSVEYDDTISNGDFLKVTGVNSAGQPIVQKQTTTTIARYVAMFDGVDGDVKEALYRGVTKVTFGGDVTVGLSFVVSANKAIAQSAAGDGKKSGWTISNGAADNDTGLVFFDGGAQD